MTLREIMAAKAAAAAPAQAPVSTPAQPPTPTPPPVPGPPDRQLGAENDGEHDNVLPMQWPVDPALCEGNQLTVRIDEHNEGWLGIQLKDGRFLPLLRGLRAIGIPF